MTVLVDDGRPNLAVVDEAFGFHADLYTDVLQVQPNAGAEQIQEAYFDRRNELFQLLADIDYSDTPDTDSIMDSHRHHAERKMDAVVCAVRVLGDPDLRLLYDDLRTERVRGRPQRRRSLQPIVVRAAPHYQGGDSGREHYQQVIKKRMSMPTHGQSRDYLRLQQHQLERQINSSPSSASEHSSSRISVPGLNTTNNTVDTSGAHFSVGGASADDDEEENPPYIPRPANSTLIRTVAATPASSASRHVPVVSPASSGRPPAVRRPLQPPQFPPTQPSNIPAQRKILKSLSTDGEGSTARSAESPYVSDDDDDEDEDQTVYTVDDASVSESVVAAQPDKPVGLVERIRWEIVGALDDATQAFEQVMNAFTLQEEDIKAVMGRIDKAKRQVSETHILYAAPEEHDDPPPAFATRKSPSASRPMRKVNV